MRDKKEKQGVMIRVTEKRKQGTGWKEIAGGSGRRGEGVDEKRKGGGKEIADGRDRVEEKPCYTTF